MSLVATATLRQTAHSARVGTPAERPFRVLERNYRVARHYRMAIITSFVEPVIMLLSLGMGVGEMVGKLPGPGGRPLPYDQFVAPALLANAAMNTALLDTTFNFFVKFKYAKAYDAMLATPIEATDVVVGEVVYTVGKGTIYAAGFLLVMAAFGLTPSAWAVLCVPVAILVMFAFGGAGLAATTYMRSYLDFDKVAMAMVPLFLFSATFFPLERYPSGMATVIRWTPLYQGVDLARSVTLGELHPGLLWHVLYLLVMGWVGIQIAGRRMNKLLKP